MSQGGGPSHVFMTADAVGGVWTYAVDLTEGLAAAGVHTTLAVLGPLPGPAAEATARRIPGLRLIDTGLPLDWTADNTADVTASARSLGVLANDSGADVIHLSSPALAADADFQAPVVGVCHSDLASWWDAVHPAQSLPEDFRWRAAQLSRGYGACDVLLAPTAAFAAETTRLYGLRPAVVRNGRSQRHQASSERERLVLTSGRLWDDGKNIATLDAAAARLDAPVVALGPLEGPSGDRVRLSSVRALGRVDEEVVARRLARASVFCSLALYEPFGLGVLEAAQAGCALVLSDIPTFRELWDGAAVFVPARDAEATATALQRLLDDPAEAQRLGLAAAERARVYSAEAMTTGVLAAYARLLGAPIEAAA